MSKEGWKECIVCGHKVTMTTMCPICIKHGEVRTELICKTIRTTESYKTQVAGCFEAIAKLQFDGTHYVHEAWLRQELFYLAHEISHFTNIVGEMMRVGALPIATGLGSMTPDSVETEATKLLEEMKDEKGGKEKEEGLEKPSPEEGKRPANSGNGGSVTP